MAKCLEDIGELIENTRFKRRVFGGLDEADVWQKIGRLQEEYQEMFDLMQKEHKLRLAEWKGYADALEKQLSGHDSAGEEK